MSVDKRLGGRIERHGGKDVIVVERSIDQLGHGNVGRYILKNQKYLSQKYWQWLLPDRKKSRAGDLMVFDSETTGLGDAFSVVSIAYAHVKVFGNHTINDVEHFEHPKVPNQELFDVNDSIRVTCLFPPNYAREAGVLRAFFDAAKKHYVYFTWNGGSFDIPRLSDRARQNGVPVNGNPIESFADHIKGQHIDLYPQAGRLLELPAKKGYRKLSAIENMLFNEYRNGDIAPSRIGSAYREFVYGRDNQDEIAQIIRHNMLDTLTPLAVLIKMIKRKLGDE